VKAYQGRLTDVHGTVVRALLRQVPDRVSGES
jgi:hypothetical protein